MNGNHVAAQDCFHCRQLCLHPRLPDLYCQAKSFSLGSLDPEFSESEEATNGSAEKPL